MIDQAKAQFDHFRRSCSEMEAMADAVGQTCYKLSLSDKAQFILMMEALVERIDSMRPIINRNLTPTRLAMAKQLIASDQDETTMFGHKFTVASKCHFSPPPKTKRPAEYNSLIKWLASNGHADVIEETTTVKVGGKDLSELCRKMLEDGQPLPPYVSEFNEISIKTKEMKK